MNPKNPTPNHTMRCTTVISTTVALFLGLVTTGAEGQRPRASQPARAAQPVRKAPALPSMSAIKQAVESNFKADPNYRPGDLITRDEVEPLLAKLQRMGLPLPDAKQILEKVLTSDDFVAKQFSTPNGQKFMRQINRYKGGYDRVDRLSRIPLGEQTVRDLIRGPDGYKMIEYMITAPGGRALKDEFARVPKGQDFNDPTGRIYTEEQLLAQLEKSLNDSLKAKKR